MSNDHVIDTPVKLARCNRCGSYVWLAMASGVRSAADTAPATHAAWIAAIADGRRTFRLTRAAGKPHKLLCVPLGGKPPVFTPAGLQDVTGGAPEVVVEHGCGGHARNMLRFTEVEQAPAQTVCDTWKASGWTPPPGKCERDRGRSVVSCPLCDRPPFSDGPPLGHKLEPHTTEEAGLDRSRRNPQDGGAGAVLDRLGHPGESGGPEDGYRQPWLRGVFGSGNPGAATSPDPRTEDRGRPDRGSHQPQHPGQQAVQSQGRNSGGIQSESERATLPMGCRGATPELREVPREGQAVSNYVRPGHVQLPGGSDCGSREVPVGGTLQRESGGVQGQRSAPSPEWHAGKVSDMRSEPSAIPNVVRSISGEDLSQSRNLQPGNLRHRVGSTASDNRVRQPGATHSGASESAPGFGRAHPPQRNVGQVSNLQSSPVRCDICNTLIDQTKPFTGISHGTRWVWAVHEECS